MKKSLNLSYVLLIFFPITIQAQLYWKDSFSSSNWKNNYDMSAEQNFRHIPNGGVDGNGCVEVSVVKNTHHGGSIKYLFKEKLGFEPEEVYAEYSVKYDSDMREYGGKAPGFSGTYDRAGWGNRPGYGKAGWSARGTINCDNQPYTTNRWYVYHTYTNYDAPNCPGSNNYRNCNPFPYDVSNPRSQPHASTKTWGSGLNWGNKGDMQFNEWYDVKQYIKLNTPGQNNGILRVWVNGQLANQYTNINFRRTDELKVFAYWFNYYNGGSNTIRETGHLRIDNFKLYGPDGDGEPSQVAVTGVSLSPESINLNVENTTNLNASVSPNNATNKSVTWSSSNTSVATVSDSGIVSAIARGTAIITVTTIDGSKTDTSTVNVTDPDEEVTVTLSPIQDAYLQGSTRNNNTLIRVEKDNRLGYLKYDLSTISGSIISAKLKLKCIGDRGNGIVNIGLGNTNNWTENNISNSNKPTSTAVIGSLNSNYSIGTTYTWNLETNALTNDGKISLIITQTRGNDIAFASKENSATAPQLQITYVSGRRTAIPDTKEIEVYPNPFTSSVTLTLKDNHDFDTLELYGLNGKSYVSKTINNSDKKLVLEDLHIRKGLYFIKLTGKNTSRTIRLMKN